LLRAGGAISLSAGDLVGHLNCRYLTELDLKVANGQLEKPSVWDPVLAAIAERGALHERAFIDSIKSDGIAVTEIGGVGVDAASVAATTKAMFRGDAIVVQGALQAGRWNGRADVLRRIETPSRFGSWSYEVIDTKLARETKGNTVLQISLYSDLLSEAQGAMPVSAHVVVPGTNFTPETYRVADYAAYYRHVRKSLERAVEYEGPAPFIRSQLSIVKSAAGAANATQEGERTITCLLSRALASRRSENYQAAGLRARPRWLHCLCRFNGGPIAARSRATKRSVSRPGFRSRVEQRERSFTRHWRRPRDSAYPAFPSHRPETSSSTSRVIPS
jgi:hypothetical protein